MNIYKLARENAKLTQEQLAEKLDMSVDSIRDYECDITTPKNKTVRKMCDIYGNHSLLYQHMQQEGLGELLPKLEFVGPQGATLDLLDALQDLQKGIPRLIEIVKDGKVEDHEKEDYKNFLEEATGLFKPIIELMFTTH